MADSGKRDRVFVSYSHHDSEWLDKLHAVLGPDVRNGRIQYFDDRELAPGDPWYSEITGAIDHAKVAVLLVSPNFLASKFISDDELPRILRAMDDGLTVLWVPLSGKFYGPDAVPGSEKLAELQAVWDAAQTLDSLPEESRAGRLLDLCRRINAHMVPRVPFNIPFGSLGDLFKGREQELSSLDAQLKLRGASAILQPRAISGLGGIGKTRLAIEYAHRHRDEFTAVLFVSANTPADLEANLARLCADDRALDLVEFGRAQQPEQYAAVVRWLSQRTGWLLILDNVDTEEALQAVQSLAATLHGGHILITSRLTGWGDSVRTISLDVIPLDDAVALLLQKVNGGRRRPRPDDAEKARALATELGCLPLALTHAGAYIRWGDKSFDRYLAEFDKALEFHKRGMIEYDPDPNTDRAAKTVATTYFLSINLLGATEKTLLRAASVLAPAPIPIAMFEECPDEFGVLVKMWCEEAGEPFAETDAEDALSELANYSLVERADGSFSIHRMERLVLSHRIPRNSFPNWVEATRAVLEKYAPDETAEHPKTWPAWDKLRPHAEAMYAAQSADSRVSPSLPLLIALGQLYFGKGLYPQNLAVDEVALPLAERTDGAESESVAGRLLAYGETLRVMGRYVDAEAAFRRSMAISEKLEGPDSIDVADALNYVAITVSNLGQEQEEEALLRRALAIYESKTDPGKDGFGKILANLGILVLNQGRVDEAEQYVTRALSAWEDALGTKHPRTIGIMCMKAHVLAHQGHTAEAVSLHRQAVALLEEVMGPEHPDTLTGMGSLANLLISLGTYEEAESLLRRTLEGRERVLGAEHPNTLGSAVALGGFLDDRGMHAEAQTLLRRALEIQDRVLGPEHPQTLVTLNNLAVSLYRVARYAEAETLFRRALDVFERKPDDARLPTCINNLAGVLEQTGRSEEAVDMRLRALAQRRAADQSQVDPQLAVELNNLGMTYRKLGQFDKAETLAREALELDRVHRGANAPIVPHRLNNLASILLLRGAMEDGRRMLSEAWAIEAGHADLTSSRIAFMRLVAALLDHQAAGVYIGQLKTLLAVDPLPDNANVAKIWEIDPVVAHLRPRLAAGEAEFLTAVAGAMNDRTKLPAVEAFPQWRSQPALPLDTP